MRLCDLFEQALSSLDRNREIFSGFGAAVDIIMNIRDDAFITMQRNGAHPLPHLSGAPRTGVLRSLDDIIACFAECVASGRGSDVPLASPEVAAPLAECFGGRRVIGGTGVQTANCLAYCGFTRLSAHVPFLAPENEALLHPAIRRYGNNAYYARVMPERKRFAGIHYILDYAAGTGVETDAGILRASHPDRLILGGNPYNAKLRIAEEFMQELGTPHPGSALILASHAAPTLYEDYLAFADDNQRLLAIYRRRNPGSGFVHMEEGHHANHAAERRKVIAERIWPLVDSVGMNEAELATLSGLMGLQSTDPWDNLLELARRHNLNRVCLHSASTCRTVTRFDPASEQKALAMGVIFASARAYYGNFSDMAGIERVLRETEHIAERLEIPAIRELAEGYAGVEVPSLRGLPVHSSIGLGDAFTAGTTACLPGGRHD